LLTSECDVALGQYNTYFIAKPYYISKQHEDVIGACANGVWGGIEYFKCKPQRGRFVLLAALEPSTLKGMYICDKQHLHIDVCTISTSFVMLVTQLECK